ncbi:hypothetical protein ACF06X_14980 [Streptomyces sp. NPDC015346]|uniref:hypothetical protein n=1 Tax=Streptomyces sp. NPDC015346 TaxID=3364954 RepID=UPI0036FE1983
MAVAATSTATQAAPKSEDVSIQASSTPGAVYQTSDGLCHFRNWGGNWFCKGTGIDLVYWNKPDGHPQVFVIGTDHSVWSRWSTASSTSSWRDMGGWCNPDYGLPARSSGWSITVACVGSDNNWWHNTRATSGSWSGWKPGKGF